MIVLVDSSTPICYLTLVDENNQQFDYQWQADRLLSRDFLTVLAGKLREFDKTLHDISAIGVMKGAGSFTGLRISLTILNTLASELDIPIVGVTNIDSQNWREEALSLLKNNQNHQLVLPFYGQEAKITTPRK